MIAGKEFTVAEAVHLMRLGALTVLDRSFSENQLQQAVLESIEIGLTHRKQRQHFEQLLARYQTLTDRELAVVDALLSGSANKSISNALNIGLRTVELRRANILKKMKARNLAELVRMIYEVRQE